LTRSEIGPIREQALALVDRGDLDRARAVLNGGRRALREDASRNEAELLADEARIDHLQLAYRNAAAKYAEAAVLQRVPTGVNRDSQGAPAERV